MSNLENSGTFPYAEFHLSMVCPEIDKARIHEIPGVINLIKQIETGNSARSIVAQHPNIWKLW